MPCNSELWVVLCKHEFDGVEYPEERRKVHALALVLYDEDTDLELYSIEPVFINEDGALDYESTYLQRDKTVLAEPPVPR